MVKPLRNKKGVTLAELMAAIMIIGLATTTLTSMIITSARGQSRATEYLLAKEVANTYNTMFCRDIQQANLADINASNFESSDPNDKYVTVSQDLLNQMTRVGTETSQTYKFLYDSNSTFTLNGNKYDSTNVTLRVQLISYQVGFRTEVIVHYANTRTVTANATQYFI